MHKSLIESIAYAVRYFRKEKCLSQEELANKSKLDRTYISGVERGVRNITIESLEQIIKALNITNSEFFIFATKDCNDDLHN